MSHTFSESNGKSIYIRNFPPSTNENTLWKIFSQFGKVNATKICIIMRKAQEMPTLFGYVEFQEEKSVEYVLKEKVLILQKLVMIE